MLCRSKCFINSTDWESICKTWNIQPVCNDIAKEEFEFEAFVPREHITPVAHCLHLRVDRVKFEHGNLSYLHCPMDFPFFGIDCKISCNDTDVTDIIAPGIPDDQAYGLYQFWLMFILLIVSWAGMAVVVSVGDAIAFEMLGDQPHLYGNQRLWGAVGWGTLAFITGFVVDKVSSSSTEKDYRIIFYIVLILILFDMFISSKLQVTFITIFEQIVSNKNFIESEIGKYNTIDNIIYLQGV